MFFLFLFASLDFVVLAVDVAALLHDCLLIFSTFGPTFRSSVFDFLPR